MTSGPSCSACLTCCSRLHRKAKQRIGSQQLAGQHRVEIALPDVRAVGADRGDQVHPVVDDQRH